MSGDLLILIELSLVFLVVFGLGFNELRQLKKYKKKTRKGTTDETAADKRDV